MLITVTWDKQEVDSLVRIQVYMQIRFEKHHRNWQSGHTREGVAFGSVWRVDEARASKMGQSLKAVGSAIPATDH